MQYGRETPIPMVCEVVGLFRTILYQYLEPENISHGWKKVDAGR